MADFWKQDKNFLSSIKYNHRKNALEREAILSILLCSVGLKIKVGFFANVSHEVQTYRVAMPLPLPHQFNVEGSYLQCDNMTHINIVQGAAGDNFNTWCLIVLTIFSKVVVSQWKFLWLHQASFFVCSACNLWSIVLLSRCFTQ